MEFDELAHADNHPGSDGFFAKVKDFFERIGE